MKTVLHGLLTDNQDGGYTLELFPTGSDRLIAQITEYGEDANLSRLWEYGYPSEVELEFDDSGILIGEAVMNFGQYNDKQDTSI